MSSGLKAITCYHMYKYSFAFVRVLVSSQEVDQSVYSIGPSDFKVPNLRDSSCPLHTTQNNLRALLCPDCTSFMKSLLHFQCFHQAVLAGTFETRCAPLKLYDNTSSLKKMMINGQNFSETFSLISGAIQGWLRAAQSWLHLENQPPLKSGIKKREEYKKIESLGFL